MCTLFKAHTVETLFPFLLRHNNIFRVVAVAMITPPKPHPALEENAKMTMVVEAQVARRAQTKSAGREAERGVNRGQASADPPPTVRVWWEYLREELFQTTIYWCLSWGQRQPELDVR